MLASIEAFVSKYSQLGERNIDSTRLIGKAPHVGRDAYLHRLMAPCDAQSLAIIESEIRKRLPKPFKAFLSHYNGICIFGTTLAIYGHRTNFSRSIESVLAQPFSIVTPNTIECPSWIGDEDIIIGGYDWDGSLLSMNRMGSVTLRVSDTGLLIKSWKSFEMMIEKELSRLSNLFDVNGLEIDASVSTLP